MHVPKLPPFMNFIWIWNVYYKFASVALCRMLCRAQLQRRTPGTPERAHRVLLLHICFWSRINAACEFLIASYECLSVFTIFFPKVILCVWCIMGPMLEFYHIKNNDYQTVYRIGFIFSKAFINFCNFCLSIVEFSNI